MRNFEKWMFIGGATMVMAATGITGCATHSDERTTTQRMSDRVTAHRVREQLAHSPIYKFTDVGVSSFENQVQLNGFVNTEEQKRIAEDLARSTPGVASVLNNIAIKPEPLVPTGRLDATQPNPPADQPPPPAPSNPAQ